ncbi:Urea carboxylase-related aminomethyltransferase [[Actinomadura] parvosata subsp. kistnae]|uniref:Urea carboxylase n=1 Tax=[Actinomadura] parvosata subsp. kistnae TaxID=1909395 RepID=A0A1U9ZUF6_9ACTN|nr:urea amidolyase associated protein UAAP1 [Nonomuraea sp. ATCC 55076]AQZ61567.1 urea carboxylase [Nonomuraea sp. ATCC 55076]SPL87638.1 Urea carboxylase-related aminomethyltransferase [Actinomadura parvosata subsp. kistnae]
MTTLQNGTATTAGARAHARAQEGTAVHTAPTVPAARWENPPEGVAAADLVWADRVPAGGYAHRVLAPGTAIRLTDPEGDACASLLLFHAGMPWERLNVADTVKVQWQVYAGASYLLLSDQARVLATILHDGSGRHDTLYGTSTRARNERRYGDGSPHGPSPAGRELLALAGAKNGLERRDLPPSISLFQGVRIDADGRPEWQGSAGPGASVTLRTELPVIVLLANAAHPLDPRPDYTVTPLEILAWRDRVTTPDDPQWSATPEGRRAYENTADHRKGRGL